MDILDRKILQLEIEGTALSKEKDSASQQRLMLVHQELAKLKEQLSPLRLQYQQEKERVEELRKLQKKMEELKNKIADAERRYDLATAADLKFYAIPDLQKKISEIEERHEKDLNDTASHESRLCTEHVFPEQIMEVVAKSTGIPVSRLSKTQVDRLLHLEDALHKRVIGQDKAVKSVADAIIRSRAGLSGSGVIGAFLFCGQTGTGKTELAKTLAKELFDDDKKGLMRIDMSEYMEQHSVSRLIGAPPGYVGYESGGQLDHVRKHPYCVLLFDEIEKAHPQVLNVLLQLLDEGRLTDGQGRLIDFSNTVVIMTSNVGSHFLSDAGIQEAEENVMKAIRSTFKPELLNRITDIVIFQPLLKSQLYQIVNVLLSEVGSRLQSRQIDLSVTQSATSCILEAAYDPLYGARPLKRYLEKLIVTRLAKLLLSGDITEGSSIQIATRGEAGKKSFQLEGDLVFSIN